MRSRALVVFAARALQADGSMMNRTVIIKFGLIVAERALRSAEVRRKRAMIM